MNLKCKDGLIRSFEIVHPEGDRIFNRLTKYKGTVDSYCRICGKFFGNDNLKAVIPKFRNHICDNKK
uniref:Uncharacterized protein n=1 Tax=viral metagenome TaxID=1070528 RepID=A0A6M3LXU5_9ZZZZ